MPAAARPVGAHVPTAGGLARSALPYLDSARAEVVQVFVSNPRGWALSPGDPAQDEEFRAGCAARGVPAYIHACLLVNLGSPTPATVERSVATLAHALRRGAAIGARGVVFHAGSAVTAAPGEQTRRGYAAAALRQVRRALLPLLDEASARGWPPLLVEPSAGGGRSLAARVEQLGPYLDAVDRHPALGVCLDTCHAWAAGHDLAAPGGMTATLDALVAACGADRLWLVHANDSRDACGSTRDRHENVGKGSIGEAAFAELLRHPATAGVPVVVETPTTGFAGHAADIARLRSLRTECGDVVRSVAGTTT
ncbi:MAG TPA: deoxyribonuclease IV [Micromonosporaceae bacterium]|nr:deoxyribonuclease IV [Micromonosporaceae bacterium]